MEQGAYDVLDLKALKCFWAVAKHGSLTRAGIELGISESAISQRLKSLEAFLATKLYESPGGKVRLTESGQRLMEMAISVFDQLEQFQEDLHQSTSHGSLQLATQEATLRYALPLTFREFKRQHPKVQIRILSRQVPDTIDLVRQGEVDLGIVSQVSLPENLAFFPWQTYEAYLLLPQGHPLLKEGAPNFHELLTQRTVMEHPLIVPERGDPAHSRVAAALERLGLPFNVAFEVGTIEAVKHYVELGLGVGVVSGICLTEGDKRRLEIINIPQQYGGTTTYGVVLRRDKYMTRALADFLSLLDVKAESGRQKR